MIELQSTSHLKIYQNDESASLPLLDQSGGADEIYLKNMDSSSKLGPTPKQGHYKIDDIESASKTIKALN